MDENKKSLIDQFVRDIVSELNTDEDRLVRRKLSVVLKKCGYQVRRPDVLKYLERELERDHVYVDPPLTEVRSTGWVRFHRDLKAVGSPFDLLLHAEKELEELLLDVFERLPEFQGLEKPQRQVRVGDSGRIDILCRDKHTKDYVVIELKARQPDDGTLEQLVDYMTKIQSTKADPAGVGVRGIVISGRPSERIMTAMHAVTFHIDWLAYKVGIAVFQMPRDAESRSVVVNEVNHRTGRRSSKSSSAPSALSCRAESVPPGP